MSGLYDRVIEELGEYECKFQLLIKASPRFFYNFLKIEAKDAICTIAGNYFAIGYRLKITTDEIDDEYCYDDNDYFVRDPYYCNLTLEIIHLIEDQIRIWGMYEGTICVILPSIFTNFNIIEENIPNPLMNKIYEENSTLTDSDKLNIKINRILNMIDKDDSEIKRLQKSIYNPSIIPWKNAPKPKQENYKLVWDMRQAGYTWGQIDEEIPISTAKRYMRQMESWSNK